MEPLASRMRPEKMEDVLGQENILSDGRIIDSLLKNRRLMNMIFYGPPGTGKTTVARILAKELDREIFMLNASTDTLKDVKDVLSNLDTMMGYEGIILYIDEIHMFNKRNQQILLDYIENGRVILIGSTTENPYFAVFKALVSRSMIVEFRPLSHETIRKGIEKGIEFLKSENHLKEIKVEDTVIENLAFRSSGDMRRALNETEVLFLSKLRAGLDSVEITAEDAENILQVKMMNFDRDGDSHYDLLSAFHKSVRGSDPDAAIAYLYMLLKGGDLISVSRRLLAIASEDIGLAYPMAVTIVKSCVDSALQLGMPEAYLPMSQAAILLATSPKSNSAAKAYWNASAAIEGGNFGEIPLYLKDGHYEGAKTLGRMQGYIYPHDFPDHWTRQEYMPSGLKGKKFYEFSDNRLEETSRKYWEAIKSEDEKKGKKHKD